MSATTIPARTAPHEIWFIKMVRASSAGVTGLRCGASESPRARGVTGCFRDCPIPPLSVVELG